METDKKAPETARVKDPVCGMMVDPAAARGGTFQHNGTTYSFCNPKCNERFRADPAKYLNPDYNPGAHAMGTTMVQLGAKPITNDLSKSTSPEALTAPEHGAHSTELRNSQPGRTSSKPSYVCPMCPEVRSEVPAACPSCGMALEPEFPTALSSQVEYVCPMHPDIVRDQPGS
jgi:Cu+-exporting ATPase